MSAPFGAHSDAESPKESQASAPRLRQEPGNAATVRAVLELAPLSRQLRAESCCSKVHECCLRIAQSIRSIQSHARGLQQSNEICSLMLSDVFFSLAVVLEKHRQIQDTFASSVLSIFGTLFPEEECVEDIASNNLTCLTAEQTSEFTAEVASATMDTTLPEAADDRISDSGRETLAAVGHAAANQTEIQLETSKTVQSTAEVSEKSEPPSAARGAPSFCDQSKTPLSCHGLANLSLAETANRPQDIGEAQRDNSWRNKANRRLDCESSPLVSTDEMRPTLSEQRCSTEISSDADDEANLSQLRGRLSNSRPLRIPGEKTRVMCGLPDSPRSDTKRRVAEITESDLLPWTLRTDHREQTWLFNIDQALQQAGRGAMACIALFLIERGRSNVHWRQRLEALRSLGWFCKCLPCNELRSLFPGLISGLVSILLGDAQTRAVVIAEAAYCFSLLVSLALGLAKSDGQMRTESYPAPLALLAKENQSKENLGAPTEHRPSDQQIGRDGDDWIESVAPKLNILLCRILIESSNPFSLHDHRSPAVQAAGARLCAEIILILHEHAVLAEKVPIIFASLAYYLTSEHREIAMIALRYLRHVEDALSGEVAENALDWNIAELEEESCKPQPSNTRKGKLARNMAGLFGYLGQLDQTAVPLRLVRYIQENRRVLDALLLSVAIENAAGDQSIRLWRWCIDRNNRRQAVNRRAACFLDLAYFLGAVTSLDPFVDLVVALLEGARLDAQVVPIARLMSLTNRLMQGALSVRDAMDLRHHSTLSNCDDILTLYLSLGTKYLGISEIQIQILRGIRLFAESAAFPSADFSRFFMHKYLAYVAPLTLQRGKSTEHDATPSKCKVLIGDTVPACPVVAQQTPNISCNSVYTEAIECLNAIAKAAGFSSVEDLARAQFSLLVDVVRDEAALRFLFEAAGAEYLLLAKDEIACIAHGIAFQTSARALKQLDLLEGICLLIRNHPLLFVKETEADEWETNEDRPTLRHLTQLLESILRAAIAALERPIPLIRRAALRLLRSHLQCLAQRQQLLLPAVAAVLDAVPRNIRYMPADVLLAACEVVEEAFKVAPWFATSRTGAIWSAFAAFLPQPLGTKPHRALKGNIRVDSKQFKLVRGTTWAVIARIFQCLQKIPPSSLSKYEESVLAACAAVGNFEKPGRPSAGADYYSARSAAQALESALCQWTQDQNP
jgi:hypothetical protein